MMLKKAPHFLLIASAFLLFGFTSIKQTVEQKTTFQTGQAFGLNENMVFTVRLIPVEEVKDGTLALDVVLEKFSYTFSSSTSNFEFDTEKVSTLPQVAALKELTEKPIRVILDPKKKMLDYAKELLTTLQNYPFAAEVFPAEEIGWLLEKDSVLLADGSNTSITVYLSPFLSNLQVDAKVEKKRGELFHAEFKSPLQLEDKDAESQVTFTLKGETEGKWIAKDQALALQATEKTILQDEKESNLKLTVETDISSTALSTPTDKP